MKINQGYITKNPVVFLTFIRPDIASEVFARIRENKPRKLYIFSDGPRNNVEEEMVKKTREKLLGMVDWECDLTTRFLDENKGVYNIWRYVCDEVFALEETMIFLQEDLLPSNSFFRFCDEMLDYFNNDHSIYMISGMNYLGDYKNLSDFSYFFKERNTTLGIAIWKRTYKKFLNKDSALLNNSYYQRLVDQILVNLNKKHWISKYKSLDNSNTAEIHIGEEFDLMGINPNILYGQLVVIPKVNLIKHIGFDDNSENMNESKSMPKAMMQLNQMELHDLTFPIIHQEYRIVDVLYKNLLSENFPSKSKTTLFFIKIERGLRVLIFLGPRVFYQKLFRVIRRIINN